MKNIQADIKSGNFKQVYLLYGEEAYLKQQYKQNLVKALNPDGDTMNFNHYEGKGIDVKQLIDLCETMPFFAERRVILLEDTGFFKNKCEELADYMKEHPGLADREYKTECRRVFGWVPDVVSNMLREAGTSVGREKI